MTQREHQVRERAYYIWEGEGRIFGRAEAHWLQAEGEILASAPLLVQAATPDLTLAPSPAQVLAETLKAKPSRSRSVTAQAEAKAKVAVKAVAEKAPKPAKVSAKAPAKTATVKAEPAAKGRSKSAARPRAAAEAVATVH